MDFDGFYLSYASACRGGFPPSLSPSVHHLMKHYSPEFYLRIVLQQRVGLWRTGVYVMQMCPGIPAHMTPCRRCEKKPQTPALKSTSVSNNNVLYVTCFYVGKYAEKKKKASHFFEKHL